MSDRSIWKARMASLPDVAWVLIVFPLIVGGIMTGFFTPSEAGGVGTFAILILATPIFYPVVLKLGFSLLWFGISLGVVLMIGVVIPPVAVCVFVVKNITKEPMGIIYKGVAPFLLSLVIVWGLLFVFPQLALWLPSLFYD